MSFVSTTILLFFVLDPIGNIPLFLSVLREAPGDRFRIVVLRECLIAFIVLLLFLFFGEIFLQALHLSGTSIGIAGGIVLFLIAVRMIFPTSDQLFGEEIAGEPLLFPLAIPTIAGPSALATVLLLVSRNPELLWTDVAALAVAMGVSTLILICSGQIAAFVGARVMRAAQRLMGLILTAVAVEMLLQGVRTFVASLRT